MWLLWIFSLAASSLLPATGEVVNSFNPCKKSFLNGKPPNLVPGSPAIICQKYKNVYRFATMYDRSARIPVFSAYEFKSGPAGRPTVPWMIEPQLVPPKNATRVNMEPEQTCGIPLTLLQKSQAVLSDYANANSYIMGHLSPVCHHKFNVQKKATFTLTNVVPLDSTLNNGKWKSYELDIKNKYTKGCLHTYIIVGAVPGNTELKNRVNIPSHIWAAVCCQLPQRKTKSKGVIAVNNQNNRIREISLKQLESSLNRHYRKNNINLFNDACY